MATDQEWIGDYFGKVVKMFQLQDNLTLSSLSPIEAGIDVSHPSGKGFVSVYQSLGDNPDCDLILFRGIRALAVQLS